MVNKGYATILMGLMSMMIASLMFYFDMRSLIIYTLFVVGFFLVGIGILLGFAKMVLEDDKKQGDKKNESSKNGNE